jgi:hypothetical protein
VIFVVESRSGHPPLLFRPCAVALRPPVSVTIDCAARN